MKFEKGYPYVGESSNDVVLFTSANHGAAIDSLNWPAGEFANDWSEGLFKNITKQYLSNTYGKVINEEHREMIIRLSKNAGFLLNDTHGVDSDWFYITADSFGFERKWYCKIDAKLITFPMPSVETKDNPWPQVGDDVAHRDVEGNYQILALDGDYAWVKDLDTDDLHYHIFEIARLVKPKTEEELLRDDIMDIIINEQDPLVSSLRLMDGFSITRKDK